MIAIDDTMQPSNKYISGVKLENTVWPQCQTGTKSSSSLDIY